MVRKCSITWVETRMLITPRSSTQATPASGSMIGVLLIGHAVGVFDDPIGLARSRPPVALADLPAATTLSGA